MQGVYMATQKQKALAKKILENPSLSMHKAMVDVGYSENTAIDPSNVTNSKGWQELMDKYLPDDKVLATHEAGLEANKVISVHGGNATADSNDFIEVPDHPTRLKAVELAYKVKKKIGNDTVAGEMKDGDKSMRFVITRGEE